MCHTLSRITSAQPSFNAVSRPSTSPRRKPPHCFSSSGSPESAGSGTPSSQQAPQLPDSGKEARWCWEGAPAGCVQVPRSQEPPPSSVILRAHRDCLSSHTRLASIFGMPPLCWAICSKQGVRRGGTPSRYAPCPHGTQSQRGNRAHPVTTQGIGAGQLCRVLQGGGGGVPCHEDT